MSIVDRLLDALQKRISTNDMQIVDFESKKNQKIKIQNILYSYNIINNDISLADFLAFNDEEIKEFFTCLDNDKKDILFKTYSVYKPLVEMYNKIKNKYNGNFEAPQYNEALKWLNDTKEKINRYLNNSQSSNAEYINALKEDNDKYNKYYNSFNGNVLVRPINDLKDFSTLLDTLNFSDKEKYEIKKFIGVSHIKLLSVEYNSTMNEELDKYKVVLKAKKDKYQKAYNKLVKESNLDLETVNIGDLSNKYRIGEYEIRQALTAIFIEQVLDNLKNNKISVNKAILKLEDILVFSKISDSSETKEEGQEVTNEQEIITTETNNELVIDEKGIKDLEINNDELIINEAKNILQTEKELINSISEDEFSKYLASSFEDSSNESIKYQIVSILLALHGEIEKYNNANDLDHIRKQVISNINDYIEAYKILKSKLNL